MPPKRKTARGGGRPKRPRDPSPVAQGFEEQVQKRQCIEENRDVHAPEGIEGGSSKIPTKLLLKGDKDADREDDRIAAMRDENVRKSQVLTHPGAGLEYEGEQHMEHETMKEGGEGHQDDDEEDSADPSPPTSSRGRGRGRGGRARGAGGGRTRSRPRKIIQQSHAQPTSDDSNPTRGIGGDIASLNPLPTNVPPAQDINFKSVGDGEADTEDGGEAEAEVPPHRPLSRPSSSEPQFQEDHSQQQHSNHITGVNHTLQPPPGTFPPHAHPYYPSYPVHPSPFSYAYVVPPPPPAPDGRHYLTLRPDGTHPLYGTSFATTVGTANGTGSASSSFNTSYPGSEAAAQSLNTNVPQGNPFPPSAPMPVPAYGTAVYSVGVSDDDDEEDHGQGRHGGHNSGKRKVQPPVKAGGRAGRGDHVACHFCRGRKLKCDGRRPTCGHCTLRSLACKYDDSVRRRGPGRKEKNNRRERNGATTRRTGGVVVSDLSADPQSPTQSHSQMTTPSTEGVKRKRRPPTHANHLHHGQTSVLRFDDADGSSASGPGMKPASAAYGVDSNVRLGYYYAGGPQYGPPYPPYGGFDPAGNPHHHPPQAAYGYTQDGEDDGDGNAEGEGEGDDDHEVYGSRPGENASYGEPPTESYTNAWPAEPPGGVPVSHPHAQRM